MTHILTKGDVEELKKVLGDLEGNYLVTAYNRLKEFIKTLEEEKENK